MANKAYPHGLKKMRTGDTDYLTDTIKCLLLVGGSFNATHEFVADLVPATNEADGGTYARVTLTGKAIDVNTTDVRIEDDADTLVFTDLDVVNGDVTAAVIFKDTGSDATSPLLYWIDETSGVTPFPFETNGLTAEIQLPNKLARHQQA